MGKLVKKIFETRDSKGNPQILSVVQRKTIFGNYKEHNEVLITCNDYLDHGYYYGISVH